MNSDWVNLESVLLKIFPGAHVANTNRFTATKNNYMQLSSFVLLSPGAGVILGPSNLLCGAGINLSAFLFHHLPFCGAGGSPVSCLRLPAAGEVQGRVQHRGLQPLPDHPWTGCQISKSSKTLDPAHIKPEPVCLLNFDVFRHNLVLHQSCSLICVSNAIDTIIFQRCSSNLQSSRNLRTATRRTQSKNEQNNLKWIFQLNLGISN